MNKISPFRAVVFNQEKISDLSKVVCPPYDVISPERQQYFHQLDPHNFIRLILGQDVGGEDKYQHAAAIFSRWQEEGLLVQDNQPAFYLYSQEFKAQGRIMQRLGLIGLLRLPEKGCSVFGHEHTRLAPKEDRLKLLKQVKANLSPIFVIFSDRKKLLRGIYRKNAPIRPFIRVKDSSSVVHRLWRITSPAILGKVSKDISRKNMFIADGHHRFEVSCAYRELLRQSSGRLSGKESCNYLLAYFTAIEDKGLLILPIHRLIRLEQDIALDTLLAGLEKYFRVEQVKSRAALFTALQKSGRKTHALGMYKHKKFWLLRLKDNKILQKVITDKPAECRSLDVLALNYLILRDVLGIGLEDREQLSYNNEAEEVIRQADASDKAIAFFLNPAKVEQVMSIALSGNKMPPKTTYFYPKVLSGLVVNKLE